MIERRASGDDNFHPYLNRLGLKARGRKHGKRFVCFHFDPTTLQRPLEHFPDCRLGQRILKVENEVPAVRTQ